MATRFEKALADMEMVEMIIKVNCCPHSFGLDDDSATCSPSTNPEDCEKCWGAEVKEDEQDG